MIGNLSALAQISLFLASMVVLYMIFRVLERILANKKNGNSNGNKAGDRSTEEWEGRMVKMHMESEKRVMTSMQALMDKRTLTLIEKVTEPIVAEIRGLRDDLKERSSL